MDQKTEHDPNKLLCFAGIAWLAAMTMNVVLVRNWIPTAARASGAVDLLAAVLLIAASRRAKGAQISDAEFIQTVARYWWLGCGICLLNVVGKLVATAVVLWDHAHGIPI